MIWPFKKKKTTLGESGILAGMTDWHSHILPGVDDGIKTMESALEALGRFDELGIRRVWLTPHIMEDYPNETSRLREGFQELKDNWHGNVEIFLAAENMLDSLFEERLRKNDLLPIGSEGNHLLVETSYYTPPMGMDTTLDNILSAGYFPVLAHPERYRYMEEDDYKALKDKGILFQMNVMSLVGGYGDTARKKGEWLLRQGYIDMAGTDIHRLEALEHALSQTPSNNSFAQKLSEASKSGCIS